MPRALALFCLLGIAGCSTTPPGRPGPPIDPGALKRKVLDAERLIGARFLTPEGLLVYRLLPEAPPGSARPPYGNLADTACWGGYYLGAEALRLAATDGPAARRRTERALAGIELLFAVTGQPGLLARSADRGLSAEELAGRSGDWRRSELAGWSYRGDVSKDQYAGVLFGLGCVLRRLDGDLRDRAARLLTKIADHLDGETVAIRDADGRVTTHGQLPHRYLGFPLAANASIALAAFRLAAEAGSERHGRRYRRLVEDGYARSAAFAKVAFLGKTNRNNDHMATAGLYHLFALEKDPEVRERYRLGLERVATAARGEENAWFLGLSMACSGRDEGMLEEALSALSRLPAKRVRVPVDLRGAVEGVVPVELRPVTAFIWRSNPYELVKDPEGSRTGEEYAPIDLVLAYWLLRAHDLLE